MTFIGFITRRVLKRIVFAFIDGTESDPRQAKQKKKAASKIIMAVGLTLSIASIDFAGLIDALHDHGINIAHETITQAAEYGSDVADHTSTLIETGHHAASAADVRFGDNHLVQASVGAASTMSLSDWLTNLSWSEKGQVLEYYLSHLSPGIAERISRLPLHDALPEAEKFVSTAIRTAAQLRFGGDGPYNG